MAQLKDLPIGRKLGIVARLSVLIALGVALLTIFLTEVNSELRRADEDGRMLSEIVADNAISPLRFDDATPGAQIESTPPATVPEKKKGGTRPQRQLA